MINSNYYDKNGKPIDLMQWGKLFEDRKYKIIKQEDLPNGFKVSTVWLGIDHSFGGKVPLIFETMVFPKDNLSDMDMERYSTLKQAIEGHQLMVMKWKGKTNEA